MKLETNNLIVIILILFIYILISENNKNNEGFVFYQSSPSTRNMSYDLRCEPIIPKHNYGIMDLI